MTTLVTPGELIPFTPSDQYILDPMARDPLTAEKVKKPGAITYFFEPPDELGKARLSSDLLRRGVRFWDLARVLSNFVAEVKWRAEDPAREDWGAEELRILESYRAICADDPMAALTKPHAAGILMDRLFRESQAWRDMEAEREVYWAQYGREVARRYLRAWEGLPGKPEIVEGLVTDHSLRNIRSHTEEIGLFANRALFGPTEDEAGNSASPSPGGSSAEPSTSAATAKATRPRHRGKRTRGASSASDGRS